MSFFLQAQLVDEELILVGTIPLLLILQYDILLFVFFRQLFTYGLSTVSHIF
jgi:hypothetical protein